MVFGLAQEEHPEKPGLFAEHRQAPLLLETPVLLQTRSVDLGAPHAHDHRPCSAFAITGRPALSRSGPSFCSFTAPRGHRATFLTIEVFPFYDPPAGHFDKRVDPRNLPSLYRRPVGVASTKRWIGGWRSIRWRGSPTPYRASTLC